jgi:hypothetical protein
MYVAVDAAASGIKTCVIIAETLRLLHQIGIASTAVVQLPLSGTFEHSKPFAIALSCTCSLHC